MIHGYCIGGGFEVALGADIRIADDRAEIGIPSAKMGILLDLEYIRRPVALAARPTPARCSIRAAFPGPARPPDGARQ